MTWLEAERVLTADAVVVVPIGAAAKEHGPHLRLANDWILAERLAARVCERCDAVLAPTLGVHYYPAFVEYPGSITLRLETARDLTVDVCRSLARFGPRRFYALNTGVSTLRALTPAAAALASERILLRSTDILRILEPVEKAMAEQEGGTHADEVETSIMLWIAPDAVDMSKAVKDFDPGGKGPLTRRRPAPGEAGTYSPTGVYGDPTRATAEKGRAFAEALVAGIVAEIEDLRGAAV
jgi:creatinine amidohydrolase